MTAGCIASQPEADGTGGGARPPTSRINETVQPTEMTWANCEIGVLLGFAPLAELQVRLPDNWTAKASAARGFAAPPHNAVAGEGYYELAVIDCENHHAATGSVYVEAPAFSAYGNGGQYYVVATWTDAATVPAFAMHGWNTTNATFDVMFGQPGRTTIDGTATFEGAASAPADLGAGQLVYWHEGDFGPVAWVSDYDVIDFGFGAASSCAATGFAGANFVDGACAGEPYYEVRIPSISATLTNFVREAAG
jgi:hypothetical protein